MGEGPLLMYRSLLCILLCVCVLAIQSYPTLCDLMDCSPRGSSVHGILQAKTGVGCHFLLPCMKVKSESVGCSVLFDCFVSLWTVTHQALLSMEFYRQEYWSKLLSLLQGIFLTQGLNHGSPALQADSLPSEPSTLKHIYQQKYKNTNIILNAVELLRRKCL